MKAMNAVLGQRSGHLKEATPDDAPNTVHNSSVKLYQWAINICPKLALWKSKDVICDDINLFPLGSSVFDNNGNVVVQEVATQPLTQDLLQSSVITLHTPNFRVKDYFFCPVVSESLFIFFKFFSNVRTVTSWTRTAPVWWCGKANTPRRKSVRMPWTEPWWVHENLTNVSPQEVSVLRPYRWNFNVIWP